MKVDVAVLGSPSLIVCMVSVDVKQRSKKMCAWRSLIIYLVLKGIPLAIEVFEEAFLVTCMTSIKRHLVNSGGWGWLVIHRLLYPQWASPSPPPFHCLPPSPTHPYPYSHSRMPFIPSQINEVICSRCLSFFFFFLSFFKLSSLLMYRDGRKRRDQRDASTKHCESRLRVHRTLAADQAELLSSTVKFHDVTGDYQELTKTICKRARPLSL